MFCTTCRSWNDRHWADLLQLMLASIIQVVTIVHRLVKFRSNKGNFSISTRFKVYRSYNWPQIINFLMYPIFSGWLQYYVMGAAEEKDNKF